MGDDVPVLALVSDALVSRNDCRWPRARVPFLLDHPAKLSRRLMRRLLTWLSQQRGRRGPVSTQDARQLETASNGGVLSSTDKTVLAFRTS